MYFPETGKSRAAHANKAKACDGCTPNQPPRTCAREAGAYDVFLKPLDLPLLLERLDELKAFSHVKNCEKTT